MFLRKLFQTVPPSPPLQTSQNRLHLSLNTSQTQLLGLCCTLITIPASKKSKSKNSSQLYQSRIEEREKDNPQYDIFPTALKVLEDEPEHRREVSPIETFPFDELTDVHEVWIHTD